MITRLMGLFVLFGCLGGVFFFEGSSDAEGAFRLFHWPALLLTGIGPAALVAVCSDGRALFATFRILLGKSGRRLQRIHEREASLLRRLGEQFYSEGPKIFEEVQARGLSSFVFKVIERLSIRMPTGDIRQLLEAERDRVQTKLTQSLVILGLGVRLTPSVGMLGTILGMVQLLSTLSDPSHIGSAMSLALLTTFYGLFFSLVVWTPLQQKVERVLDVEMEGYNQTVRWLELLEKRKPANYFSEDVESSTHSESGRVDHDEPEERGRHEMKMTG